MESFTHQKVADRRLPGLNMLVVRSRPPHVGGAVDQPGQVEGHAVAEHDANEKGIPQTLTPEEVRNHCGKGAPNKEQKRNVIFPLEPDHWVCHQVTHVNCFALFLDIRVLLHQKPPNMREKEAPFGVVRVGVGFGEFVVHSVVPTPLVNVILERHYVEKSQNDSEGKLGFVSSM